MIDGFSFTDIAVLLAAMAYGVDRALDSLGWSRSSRTLRRENVDLTRRNAELDETVSRLSDELEAARKTLALLDEKVRELEKRDQAAVLAALAEQKALLGEILHALTARA